MALPGPGMIGRDDSLARIRAVAADVLAGRPQAVLVTGEAGIGRTRLVTETADELGSAGWLVARGQAVRQDGGAPPFLPFVQVLGEMMAATDPARRASILGAVGHDLQRLLPELARGGHPPDRPSGDDIGPLRQARLFEGVLDLGERVAALQPLCVVLEDVHWLDRSSADLLRFFITQAQEGRLLLLATARTGDPEADGAARLLVDLVRPSTTWIDLGRLSSEATQRLVGERLGSSAAAATVDAIARRSDGIPLVALELADASARGEASSRSIEAVMRHRLDALPHLAADSVRAAAILAPTIDETRIAVALGQPAEDVEPAIRAAVDADVLAIAGGPGGGLIFRHELLRELAEATLLPAQRRRLHRAIAEAADRDPTETPLAAGERARHWAAAGVPDRALQAAAVAQAEAAAIAAHDAVLRDGDLALLLWPHVAEADRAGLDRSTIERASAEAALCLADPMMAIALLRSAADGTTGAERAEIRGRLRFALFEAGEPGLAEADALDALAAAPTPGDEVWRAEAELHLAGLALARRAWPEALALALAARARLSDHADPKVPPRLALAAGIEGLARVELGDVDAGLASVEAAWTQAALVGPFGFDLAYRRYVGVLRRLGHHDRVLEVADEGASVAAAAGLARTLGQTLAVDAAEALLELGRWAGAAARLARLPWSHGAPGPGDRRSRVEALLRLRRDGALDMDLAQQATLDPDVRVEAALLTGAPASALAIALGVMAGDRPWPPGLGPERIATLAAWAVGDGAAIPDDVDPATRIESLIPRPIGPFAAVLDAERRRARGQHAADDDEAWVQAIEALERHGLGWWLGWARLHRAEGAASSGDLDGARDGIAEAWSIARDLPSVPLRRAIERSARRLGLPLPGTGGDGSAEASRAATGHGTSLTAREGEVLRLLVDGYSNREVAERLDISHKTASVHVSNILAKLEVDNRTQAAAVAVRLGLVGRAEGEE